jgi:hypothetical protein
MALTQTEYPKCVKHGVDYLTDAITVMLLTGSTYDATHEFLTDVNADEITGTGYTAGGLLLATPVATYDAGTNTWKFSFDDPTWPTATFSTDAAAVFKDTGVAATSPLIGYVDFGGTQAPAGVDFTLHVSASGLITRQVVAAS